MKNFVIISIAAIAIAACSTNPQTGEWEFNAPKIGISTPQEIREEQGQADATIAPSAGEVDDTSCTTEQDARNACN